MGSRSELLGERWCKIAFELLSYFQDIEKKKLLQDQVLLIIIILLYTYIYIYIYTYCAIDEHCL
jgi:hypothetical protein